MHICTFSAHTTSTTQVLWNLLTNIQLWPSWDSEVKEVELNGSFKQGSTGTITCHDGSQKKFTVVKLQVQESLVISVPYTKGTELLIKRDLRQEGSQLCFEQDVTLSGTFLTKVMMGGHKEPLRQASAQQMQKLLDVLDGKRLSTPPGLPELKPKTAH